MGPLTALSQGLSYNKRLEWTQEEAIAYECAHGVMT